MNCKELQDNIKNLKDLHAKAQERLEQAATTGHSKSEATKNLDNLSSTTDQILEHYLDDFDKQFPGLFITLELGEPIEEFNNLDLTKLSGSSFISCNKNQSNQDCVFRIFNETSDQHWTPQSETITISDFHLKYILPVSNDECLIIGEPTNPTNPKKPIHHQAYILRKTNGNWQIEKNIINLNDTVQGIATPVSNNECLFYNNSNSNNSTVHSLQKDRKGKWEYTLEPAIKSFDYIDQIEPLSEKECVITGNNHSTDISIIKQNIFGNWAISENIYGITGTISHAAVLSENEFIVNVINDDFEHKTYSFKRNSDGYWILSEMPSDLNDFDQLFKLSDDEHLVLDDDGKIKILQKDSNKNWIVTKQPNPLKDDTKLIYETSQLSNGRFIIHVRSHQTNRIESRILSLNRTINLGTLKQNLSILFDEDKDEDDYEDD